MILEKNDDKNNEFKMKKEKKIIFNNIFDIKKEKINLINNKDSKELSIKKKFSFTKKSKEKFISKENTPLPNTEIDKSQNGSLQSKSDSKTIKSKDNKRNEFTLII